MDKPKNWALFVLKGPAEHRISETPIDDYLHVKKSISLR